MTYPEAPLNSQHVGIFKEEGRSADKRRERLTAIALEWFHKCQSERQKIERQWYLNYAFLTGNQYVQFRSVGRPSNFDLYTPPAPYYRVRIVVNQIRKIVRKEISRLTAQKPNAFVVPSSVEDQDVFAAQAGEQIWDSLWRRLNLNRVLREAVFWQVVCGNGFLKSYWDETKIDPDSGLPGDVCIEKITPFHLYVPDQMATDLEDQPYIIHAQVKHKSWIAKNFKVDVAKQEKFESVDEMLQQVMETRRNESKTDQAIVLEIWVKPGYLPELPEGGIFTVAGHQIVQGYETWPYEHGQYPFAKLDGLPTGKFYTASIIEDLIPLQKELNRTRSQLIEAKNRMAKPQLLAPKGSVDPKMITTEPGQVIQYAIGLDPPQPLPMQNLPTYVTEEIDRLYNDMADISGQHEVSNGSTPPGVTAATAISFLQEQDESLIAGQYTSIEEAIEKIAAQSLMYVKMYWDEKRTVKVTGLEGTFDVQSFKGSDLRSNTDIRVEAGSALPTSRAAKQAFIMDLMKMQFIPPEEGLEIMEVGGLNKIYDRIQLDKRQAQRENSKMRVITEEDQQAHMEQWSLRTPSEDPDTDPTIDPNTGMKLDPPELVPVHTYDNHELHIQIHNDYRKSQSFESASEFTKAIFERHVRAHQEAIAIQLQHPMTGLPETNPSAPSPDVEDAALQQAELEAEQESSSPGPESMPELEGEQPPEGTF